MRALGQELKQLWTEVGIHAKPNAFTTPSTQAKLIYRNMLDDIQIYVCDMIRSSNRIQTCLSRATIPVQVSIISLAHEI